jgi:hypothetical protein
MIRVIAADESESTTITVDGKLSGDYLESVETSCLQAISKGKPVRLYLRNVSTIDERGRAPLRDLAAKGVGLKASGVYSSYIVNEIQPGHAFPLRHGGKGRTDKHRDH